MATLIDYIKWRGDIEFWMDGFNEFDNMVFSSISYVEMDEVFARSECLQLSLPEICEEYFNSDLTIKKYRDNSSLKETPHILQLAAACRRYRDVRVRNYVSIIDLEKTLQFAAMEFVLPDGTSFVAFRGTDDNLVGWKEDMMLAVTEVQAEIESISYLNRIAGESKRLLRLGGHSKGGHMAVYAGSLCQPAIQNRILAIYSNDGPGFTREFVKTKSTKQIADRVVRIIPEESVVGMFMEPVGKPIIVESLNKGFMQHDMLSWCLDGMQLSTKRSISKFSKVFDGAIRQWLSNFEEEKRIGFVDDFFSVLEASGAETLTDVSTCGIKGIQKMTKQLNEISPDTKEKVVDILKCLFKEIVID